MKVSTWDDIENRFNYHPPSGAHIAETHEEIRELCKEVAFALIDMIPDCRERSTAITKLEETMMWANAAVARNMNGD